MQDKTSLEYCDDFIEKEGWVAKSSGDENRSTCDFKCIHCDKTYINGPPHAGHIKSVHKSATTVQIIFQVAGGCDGHI